MVVNSSDILYLKDKLFNILNAKMDIKELTDNMNDSNVDPEVKNLLILMYSSMVNHRSEVDRDRMLVLMQILEYINNISNEIDRIENELHLDKNNYNDDVYTDNNKVNVVDNSISVTNPPVNNPNTTKWYLNFKNIFLGGITFLPIIGGLTVIYSYNPEAAEKAVEVFFNIMIKLFLPGV